MIHLSANGEMLGQFEENAVPGMLAEGKIPDSAFYWREGMPEWRPVLELSKPVNAATETKRIAPPPGLAGARPAAEAEGSLPKVVKISLPRRVPVAEPEPAKTAQQPASAAGLAPAKPATIAVKPFMPRAVPVSVAGKLSKPEQPRPQGAALSKLVPLGGAKPFVVQRRPSPAVPAEPQEGAEVEPAASEAAPESGEVAAKTVPPVVAPRPVVVQRPRPAAPPVVGAEPSPPPAVVPDNAVPLKPVAVPPKRAFALRRPADPAAPGDASAETPSPARTLPLPTPPPASRGKRRRWPFFLVLLLCIAAAAGGGAWWWMNSEPPPIPGLIALAGDESGPVEVQVFRREDLAGPWRERLTAADARAAELEKSIAEAQAQHREKDLLREESARVCEVGEEYNMPDVADLRADRDAKQSAADAAKAELVKLQAEKASLLSLDLLLEKMPAPLQTVTADGGGKFLLPSPGAGEVVLLATAMSGASGLQQKRGWLEVLEVAEDGGAPSQLRFAETNRLDIEAIRRFAGASSP